MVRSIRSMKVVRGLFLLTACLLLLPISSVAADRQIASGPYSFTVKAGGENDTEVLGFDGRVDYLTKMVNLHLLGTYEWLNAGRGPGEIDNKKYGGALALSHTYPGLANAYVGAAFVREMGETFGHAYVGGKLKVTDYALLSATYGFGFGDVKEIKQVTSRFVGTEAVDWLKAGVVLVNSQGWKANAYYTLTDPGNLALSGVEGELSYPILDFLTAGVRGNSDLSTKSDVWRNWSTFGFLTYAFGDQKGSPIDVALEKNNPLVLPILVQKKLTVASGGTLSLSPLGATGTGSCTVGNTTKFTVSGGTPPYSWISTYGSIFPTTSVGSQAVWDPCELSPGTGTVTVTDSQGHTGSVTVTVTPIPASPIRK